MQRPNVRAGYSRATRSSDGGRTIRSMTRARLADVLFWIVASFALVCVVFFLLVLSDTVEIDSATDAGPIAQTTETEAEAETEPVATPTVRPKPKREAKPQAATPTRKPAQATAIVLTAARGDCWFQARVGSEQGRVLDERVLSQGESTTITSPRVWLAIGAAGNLDVTVNGKPRQLSAGTLAVVLDAS
jgi:hypothetical protein